MGTVIKVEKLIHKVEAQVTGDLNGMVLYAGTIPVIGSEICFSRCFEAELVDQRRGRSLRCAYSIEPIAWFKGELQIGYNILAEYPKIRELKGKGR